MPSNLFKFILLYILLLSGTSGVEHAVLLYMYKINKRLFYFIPIYLTFAHLP